MVSDLIQEELNTLTQQGHRLPDYDPKKPESLPFAVFTMGSMARQESGLYTDLEIGFIVKNDSPAVRKFLGHLTQRIADRVHVLGEEDGLHLDVEDIAPLYYQFDSRYMDHKEGIKQLYSAIEKRDYDQIPRAGSRLLIATPNRLAEYFDESQIPTMLGADKEYHQFLHAALKRPHDPDYDIQLGLEGLSNEEADFWVNESGKPFILREKQQLRNLTGLFRNVAFLFGNKALFDQYDTARNKVLERETPQYQAQAKRIKNGEKVPTSQLTHIHSIRQKVAYDSLLGQLNKPVSKRNKFLQGEMDGKLDPKRDLYRLAEQILTNLGFYYGLSTQNTHEIAQILADRNLMSKSFLKETHDLLSFLMEIRLKVQIKLKRQGSAIYFDQEEYEKDVQSLTDKIQSLEAQHDHFARFNESKSKALKLESEINTLKAKLRHLEQVAPGKVLNQKDVARLEKTYLPILRRLFDFAAQWAKNPPELKAKPRS